MAEIAGHKCLGVVCLRTTVVGRSKVSHNLVVSLEELHKVVESCMTEIEAGSGSRIVVAFKGGGLYCVCAVPLGWYEVGGADPEYPPC